MNPYVRLLRAPFLAGSITPVIIGSALAFAEKNFTLSMFLIAIIGVSALHLGANLLNDYFDAGGSDPINVRLTPFSGGSRVIQEKEVSRESVLFMALVFFGTGVVTGILFLYLDRPWVIAIGFFGLLAGWAYSAPPFALMNRGWGELLIFFAFGPAVTLGAYYVITGSLGWQSFFLGVPQGFFIAEVIWINQFPDYQADKAAEKRNLVVRWGPGKARYVYVFIMLSAFVFTAVLASTPVFSFWLLLPFFAFPLGIKAIRILMREYLSHEGIIPAQALTIQIMVLHGLLLSAGLILERIF